MNPLKAIKLAIFKNLLKTVGKLSDGVSLAFSSGMISGISLDYIYRNQPSGKTFLGRLIDKVYLSNRGWEAIRYRRASLEHYLAEAVTLERQRGERPVMLDIASGPAAYIIDVLSADYGADTRAVCRDLDPQSLALGRSQAESRHLSNVVFAQGDAFDEPSLAEIKPQSNIVVSSGFYDWIRDDGLIRRSMSIIHELLPPGGYFIFSNQSGHFDLDLVNYIFTDFHGQPLDMVVRPAATVNAWAETAGFNIVETTSDRLGFYSVTMAQKRCGT